METLSHILASFDIFQVILNAFPQIFMPVVHAFQGMFVMLSHLAGEQFASHPGLISGTIIFSVAYFTYIGLAKLKRTFMITRLASPEKSH